MLNTMLFCRTCTSEFTAKAATHLARRAHIEAVRLSPSLPPVQQNVMLNVAKQRLSAAMSAEVRELSAAGGIVNDRFLAEHLQLAEEVFVEMQDAFSIPRDNDSVRCAAHNYAVALEANGRASEAAEILWDNIGYEKQFGHVKMESIIIEVSRVMGKIGTPDKLRHAEVILRDHMPDTERVTATHRSADGENMPRDALDVVTMNCSVTLAEVLSKQNRHREAATLLHKALAIGTQAFGEDNAAVRYQRRCLADERRQWIHQACVGCMQFTGLLLGVTVAWYMTW